MLLSWIQSDYLVGNCIAWRREVHLARHGFRADKVKRLHEVLGYISDNTESMICSTGSRGLFRGGGVRFGQGTRMQTARQHGRINWYPPRTDDIP